MDLFNAHLTPACQPERWIKKIKNSTIFWQAQSQLQLCWIELVFSFDFPHPPGKYQNLIFKVNVHTKQYQTMPNAPSQ